MTLMVMGFLITTEINTYKTDHTKIDTDGDGFTDNWELSYNYDPKIKDDTSLDKDDDGLTDLEEQFYKTNPYSNDTDNDGLADGKETGFGGNPLDSNDAELYYTSLETLENLRQAILNRMDYKYCHLKQYFVPEVLQKTVKEIFSGSEKDAIEWQVTFDEALTYGFNLPSSMPDRLPTPWNYWIERAIQKINEYNSIRVTIYREDEYDGNPVDYYNSYGGVGKTWEEALINYNEDKISRNNKWDKLDRDAAGNQFGIEVVKRTDTYLIKHTILKKIL